MVEERNEKTEIYSKRVRAGKRTYFFDVKSTRNNDFYLTITESKRRMQDDTFVYEKHKIFLYREDFGKFIEALQEVVDHLKSGYPDNFMVEDVDPAATPDRDELSWD